MIIIMKMGAGEEEIQEVVAQIEEMGFRAHLSRGEERTIIGVIGDIGRRVVSGRLVVVAPAACGGKQRHCTEQCKQSPHSGSNHGPLH